ncbi:alpha/beta hydrolase [Lysobacter sp. K5869]|uniref:alpha/beta fold hydrolase n=1 Tax=Lysobacter sp. K5869 TaxID=2820808 RepID=UPI001C061A87|nr:alpha/beta hydrolase [Lysobacter sp. K5869]QWP77154.1 alpha/beta hydrolase [Lysobacter sp. K5869]
MSEDSQIRFASVPVGPLQVGVHQAGNPKRPALVLLHGWPHSSALYSTVMEALAADRWVLAVDLPAIASSRGAPPSAEKSVLAELVLDAVERCGAHSIVVAGLDVGGMIAFAAARDHCERIVGAAVINTVVPGVAPWKEIIATPTIWHFAFHALPQLPEVLVRGNEKAYFDYFIDALACDSNKVGSDLRRAFVEAYARPEALRAGFDWYRAMEMDAERNAIPKRIDVPMLYLRGAGGGTDGAEYVSGLRAVGAIHVQGDVIPGGEYSPLEAPLEFVSALLRFCRTCEAFERSGD